MKIQFYTKNTFENNGSQWKNPDIPGAIFTLSLSTLILNSQCVEGTKYVRVLKLTPIIIVNFGNHEILKSLLNDKFYPSKILIARKTWSTANSEIPKTDKIIFRFFLWLTLEHSNDADWTRRFIGGISTSRWFTWFIFRLTDIEPVSVKCTNCCALNFVLVRSNQSSSSICEWAKWQVSPILHVLPLDWCQHISILQPLGSRILTIFSWNKLRFGRPDGSFEVFLKRNPPP